MAERQLKLGDSVLHHGRLHKLIAIRPKAIMRDGTPVRVDMAVWDNDNFQVIGIAAELQWSEADQAWYLPGRVLAKNERALAEAVLGTWPRAENHHAVRSMLDTVDLSAVDRGRFGEVLAAKKADVRMLLDNTRALAEAQGADPEAAAKVALAGYTDAALKQCAELRGIRKEEVTNG